MHDPPSQMLTSVFLAFVAAIPNHTLRYTALSVAVVLAVLFTIRIKSPSTQLCHLAAMINTTNVLIRQAMAQCPRDYFTLTKQMGRLLEVEKIASLIKCRALISHGQRFSWKKYRLLYKDIKECIIQVKNIHTTVKLTIEAEHQRKLAADITEMQFILASAQMASNISLDITASV
ncbi:hypothetical protein MVEN_00344400 [Mycena venus]|uniref:Uncharacterized protein n=1 Tax=Mycena venus TaxID=2733690 RepID=A0A8H6YVR8_9AGAR|nr:hypothetical protein MVEN_00344400 [Mycena venus]